MTAIRKMTKLKICGKLTGVKTLKIHVLAELEKHVKALFKINALVNGIAKYRRLEKFMGATDLIPNNKPTMPEWRWLKICMANLPDKG